MATTSYIPKASWNNFHQNGPFPLEQMVKIKPDQNLPGEIQRINDAAVELRRILQLCLDEGKRLRALGSAWSMSNIAHQKHRMLDNSFLNVKLPIVQADLHAGTACLAENLYYFQCGNIVKEISNYLKLRRKSLKTCGASNGQTIAGAISTGVHGSAIDVGSMQDYVVGLNLIVGPNPEDVLYLERESRPALSDAFATSINAKPIRNDKMFNAALVGLGAFGMIHGVVVEVEPVFLLRRYIKSITKDDAMFIANSLNFEDAAFQIQEEAAAGRPNRRPWHFKFFINPYKRGDIVTEYIFKEPFRAYTNPRGIIKTSMYRDLPTLLTKLVQLCPNIVPGLVNLLGNGVFGRVDSMSEGTLGEIFWDTSLDFGSLAGSFGVDKTHSGRALEILTKLMNDSGPIPGVLAMRFVKGSDATLAFTKFPTTCVIEVDCVQWQPNGRLIGFYDFMEKVIAKFKSESIPFTLHWGKNAPWGMPGLVKLMYGAKADEWMAMRNALLSPKMADVFTNDFLEATGLANPPLPPMP